MKTLLAYFAFWAALTFSMIPCYAELPVRDTLAPENAVAVTPHDSNNLPQVATKLYVGGTGNIAMVMKSGQVVTLNAVPVGAVINASFKRINATNTTATLMVAFY
jgi:hypothetical protein